MTDSFLETKEVLGGFYLLEAANLDEVISLASGLGEVSHDHSGVEIVRLSEHRAPCDRLRPSYLRHGSAAS